MAVISRSGATTSDLHDQLGSATKQTNSGAGVTATRTYDAFGTLVASAGAPQGPFGFAAASGYQEDGDTGLKLLGHRYYDPSTGRFLTRDPIKDGRNWYAYCDNNPLGEVDPEGLNPPKVPGQKHPQKTDYPNRSIPSNGKKEAEDKATNHPQADGKPIHHPPVDGAPGHYHPTDRYGRAIPGPHYTYSEGLDWAGFGKGVLIGAGGTAVVIFVALNPELWPAAGAIGARLATQAR